VSTATQTETARFVSKGRNYRATLLSPVDHAHPVTGNKVEDQRGFTAEFSRHPFEPISDDSDGSFEWPFGTDVGEIGESGYPVYVDPVSHETVDVVKALREHEHFNIRFVELGPDPEILQREQSELLAEISRRAVSRDVDRLAEIYDNEDSGHKREPVLTAAMEALRATEEVLAAEREPSLG
jgi:hypothetical protein